MVGWEWAQKLDAAGKPGTQILDAFPVRPERVRNDRAKVLAIPARINDAPHPS